MAKLVAIPPLSPSQTALANRVLAEAIGDLAKHRVNHGSLESIADELASALHIGLGSLNRAGSSKDEPSHFTPCSWAELRRRRKEQLALLESQALKARSLAGCASCWDQGENEGPIHPQAMSCNSRGEQR